MKIVIFISALYLQLQWIYGNPESVGAYAYQDTEGNRYGGTYGVKDDQVYNFKDIDDPTTFQPNPFMGFPDLDSFFPEYFRNLENLIQDRGGPRSLTFTSTRRTGGFGFSRRSGGGFMPRATRRAFRKNAEQQQRALNAARQAFDLTSNQIGYVPNFDTGFNRFPGFPGFPGFGFPQPGLGAPGFGSLGSPFMKAYGDNSAFAGGEVGPGFRHQMVAINPTDPSMPNIDVTHFSDGTTRKSPNFYSVQSSSFVSSANVNGQETSHKGGQTIVNDNGRITKYSLNN